MATSCYVEQIFAIYGLPSRPQFAFKKPLNQKRTSITLRMTGLPLFTIYLSPFNQCDKTERPVQAEEGREENGETMSTRLRIFPNEREGERESASREGKKSVASRSGDVTERKVLR